MEVRTARSRKHTGDGLPVIHAAAAAIDVGSRFHVVAVPPALCADPVQTFQAFTGELQRMGAWLKELGITTVAIESMGVYWVPIYEVLESFGIEVIVANAREARAVSGRKSDVNDAQWLQRLHARALLRASFQPSGAIASLRAYLRLRERHLDYAASHIQHVQKALVQDEASHRHVSLPYAAISVEAAATQHAGDTAHEATELAPPPEVGRREDFRVGQRVSFIDRDLQHRIGLIVRINQQTATLDCNGQSWRVAFTLLRHVVKA